MSNILKLARWPNHGTITSFLILLGRCCCGGVVGISGGSVMNLQPIDGAYFATVYFMVSSVVDLIVAFIGAYVSEVRS